MRKIFLLFLGALFLTGCTTWTQLTQRVYQENGRGFQAEMPQDWMRFNPGPYFFMTKDGAALNLVFVERVRFDKKLEHTKKKYFEGMTLPELAEIEIDNIKSNGDLDRFELISNQPVTLDGRPAFRIEYHYVVTGSGLKVAGIQYGFVEGKWIYRIRYEAPRQHYFEKTRPDFERFIATFAVI